MKKKTGLDAVMDVIRCRRDGHWTGPLARDTDKEYLYSIIYDAIETAGELLSCRAQNILGLSYTDLGVTTKVWHGSTAITAGTVSSQDFWIPKGANRFHFAGGARYIHGGAMLQEIVIPVMTIKGLRGKAKEKSLPCQVEIAHLGSVNKVVNSIKRFEFIQTDGVSKRVLPRKLSVSLRDGEDPIATRSF